MKLIVKVFPEITIKSRPVRMRFIRQLAKNIRAVLRDLDPAVVVNGVWDNLELETRVTDAKALKDMTERLSCMPGIAHFLQVDEYPLGDFDDITEKCKQHFGSELEGKIFFGALQACRQAPVQLHGCGKNTSAASCVASAALPEFPSRRRKLKCGWKFATNGCL
jgi:adenylyl- and sulfurtransferase ThiI